MSLQLGRVTSTFIDEGVPLLNVQTDRAAVEPREVPIIRPLSGVTFMPKEGDTVVLDKLDDGTEVAMGILNRKGSDQPDHGDEEFSMTLDGNTQLSFVKNESGKYDIDIETDGRISVNSKNGFKIIDEEGFGIVSDENSPGDFKWYHKNIDLDDQNTAQIE